MEKQIEISECILEEVSGHPDLPIRYILEVPRKFYELGIPELNGNGRTAKRTEAKIIIILKKG